MTVFLRPQPAAIPTDYIRTVGKVGMIVMPQRNLAIYTCKAGPNEGSRGLAGADGQDGLDGQDGQDLVSATIFDTIICSASDQINELVVDLINPHNTFRAPYALNMVNGYIRINVNNAPTGTKLIVDLHMNGTTVFTTLISIDIDTKTSVGASIQPVLSITSIPDDAEFEIFVTQKGSTFAGTGLKIAVTGNKVIS